MKSLFASWWGGLIGVVLVMCPVDVRAITIDETKAEQIALEAYTYLYPLVIMDVTRRQQTNVVHAGDIPMRAPINQIVHLPTFPPGDFRDVVRPNFDTLYSNAWLDLTREPMILKVGDTKGRYFLLPLYDMWTDVFANPSSETLGPEGGTFAITAPGWHGTLPKGVERIEAPTPMVWIIGRVQTNGPADYAFVHDIQRSFTLVPLSQWGKPDVTPATGTTDPTVDPKSPPLATVARMDANNFFTYGLKLVQLNKPHNIDHPIIARMKMIGLVASNQFSFGKLSPMVQSALQHAAAAGQKHFVKYAMQMGEPRNGWRVRTTSIGSYGSDYLQRATIAMAGLGANRPFDAIYPRADIDSEGRQIDGAYQYIMHFPPGTLPPVGAFWSITAYDKDGFTTPNVIDRYALGDRDPLKYNADGSLDLYLQTASPGSDRNMNWLPLGPGIQNFSLRLYLPKAEALSGVWVPPPIQRVDTPPATH